MTGAGKTVKVVVVVRGEPTEDDDEGVPGRYGVDVTVVDAEPGVPLSAAQMAAVWEGALDTFHEKIGISCLDDFDISACSDQPATVQSSSEGAPTEEEVAAVSVETEWLGRID